MMTRIVIVSADLLGDIAARLQQAGHIVADIPDLDSLNAWLAGKPAVALLGKAAADRSGAQPPGIKMSETVNLAEKLSHWLLDPAKLELTSPTEHTIPLTHNECCILRAAAKATGHLVTRKMLIEGMGQNFLHYDQRRLETHISRLRRKLVTHGQKSFRVRSVKGQGYLFMVKLREIAD